MHSTGFNQFHNYKIFKDNQPVMYTDGNGAVCRSIYYILDVSIYPLELDIPLVTS